IVKVTGFEGLGVGAGFATVTVALPAVVTSLAGTTAWSSVSFMNTVVRVVRALLFHCTFAPSLKSNPFTVKVKLGLPCFTIVGDSDITTGTGLSMARVLAVGGPSPGGGVNT